MRRPAGPLAEVARLFLKLGVIGFGGPAAHIALMRDEVVRRRGWVTDAELLDLVGACNLIPGPNSTELAMALGRSRAGARGLVVAGLAFILPAALIVTGLAVLYGRVGNLPAVLDVRRGVLPVVVALVASALWSLCRAAVRSPGRLGVVAGSALAWLAGTGEPVLLLAAAVGGGIWTAGRRLRGRPGRRGGPPSSAALVPALVGLGPPPLVGLASAAPPPRPPPGLGQLFLVFLEVGALLFGSGYVLVSYLQRDLVEAAGWLTEAQLLDAVAVGQLSPGPLFTTATFLGYQLAGPAGAVVATVAIFLPSFVFVAALSPIVRLARRSPWASGALDGVNLASLGLLAGVAFRLAQAALPDPTAVVVAVTALVGVRRFGVAGGWLVAAGALFGLLTHVGV